MTSTSYNEIKGRRLLITGDLNTGKTMMTKALLEEAIEEDPGEVTVIDMAPSSVTVRGLSVGGTLAEPGEYDVRYIRSEEIRTPRLSAKTGEELLDLADHNRNEIEGLLDEFCANPSRIARARENLGRLWDAFQRAEAVVANGYLGERLGEDLGTGVSARERRLMEELASKMEVVIRL